MLEGSSAKKKIPECPGGQRVGHETAVCPRGREGQWDPRVY